jgi:hypothetical protein
MQITEQQVAQLKQMSTTFKDIFAEDTAVPTTSDEVLGLLQTQAQKEGFAEAGSWIRSLIPTKDDVTLAAAGVGAGFGAFITATIQSKIAILGSVSPVILQGVIGWLIYKWGAKYNKMLAAVGGGMVIGAIGGLVGAYAGGVVGGGTQAAGGPGVTSPSGAPADIWAAVGA